LKSVVLGNKYIAKRERHKFNSCTYALVISIFTTRLYMLALCKPMLGTGSVCLSVCLSVC